MDLNKDLLKSRKYRFKSLLSSPLGIFGLFSLLAILGIPQLFSQDGKPQNFTLPIKKMDRPVPKDDVKAVTIVNRYIKAIGGKDLLDSITDKTVVFRTIKHAPAGETEAKLKLYLKKGFKIREEWDLPGFKISDQELKFVQVYNGYDGWVQMFGTVSPLEGRTLSIFVWDKPIDDFFCTWKEDGYSVKYNGASKVNGEDAEIVQTMDYHEKNKVRYFFSKKSGLLLKKEWSDQDQKGFVKKSSLYLNYTAIPFSDDSSKKVKIARHQKIFTSQDLDSERKYTEIAFNTGLKDAIFQRPEGVEFTGGIGRDGDKKSGPTPADVFKQYQKKNKSKDGTAPANSGGPTPVQVPTSKGVNPHKK